jgi:putative GTP pyrophosphokinase
MDSLSQAHEITRQQYREGRPGYARLVDEVKFVIETQLRSYDLKVADILGRVKTEESLLNKISRRSYENPFSEVHDIAGVRVICLYETDLLLVVDCITQAFEVIDSSDKKHSLGANLMGYQGLHFVVRLGSRYAGARYEGLNFLTCEIQVRTILQDAWAQISHHLVYKTEASVPSRLRRELNNVSVLLEIAQDVFDRVRGDRQSYIDEIEQKRGSTPDFLCQPLDHETLAGYTKWKFPDLPVKPELQELLLADLDRARFNTLKHIDDAVEAAADAVKSYAAENQDLFTFGTDFITKSLGFVDMDFRQKHGFGDRTRQAFERYADKVNRKHQNV